MADPKKPTKSTVATAKAKKPAKAVEVKTAEQLHDDLAKQRQEHQESRRSHRAGDLVNPHILNTQRKQIARTLTAIKQSEITSQKEAN